MSETITCADGLTFAVKCTCGLHPLRGHPAKPVIDVRLSAEEELEALDRIRRVLGATT